MKNKKLSKIKIIFVSFFVFFIFIPCSVCLFLICTPKANTITQYNDYIFLLGGGLSKEGKLFPQTEKRCEKAVKVWQNVKTLYGENTKIIVTGGTLKASGSNEAYAMKTKLIELGISEQDILPEDKALDTIQNFKYSAGLIAQFEGISLEQALERNIIVVTQKFHLRRALFIGKRLGFKNISGFGADSTPSSIFVSYGREILSYIKLALRIIFTGEPKKIQESQENFNCLRFKTDFPESAVLNL
ncbi:MAG: YdcF family protein [Treponemataceae bacterium]